MSDPRLHASFGSSGCSPHGFVASTSPISGVGFAGLDAAAGDLVYRKDPQQKWQLERMDRSGRYAPRLFPLRLRRRQQPTAGTNRNGHAHDGTDGDTNQHLCAHIQQYGRPKGYENNLCRFSRIEAPVKLLLFGDGNSDIYGTWPNDRWWIWKELGSANSPGFNRLAQGDKGAVRHDRRSNYGRAGWGYSPDNAGKPSGRSRKYHPRCPTRRRW